MSKVTETTLEIDLGALKHNYNFIKSKVKGTTKFLAVVKAFAYGTDMVTVAQNLESFGVDYFAVAYTKEGELLRDNGITKPILVLHPQIVHFKTIIERCLEPSMYSPKILREFVALASSLGENNYPVHLKFNTGLNRLGFGEDNVDYILNELSPSVSVKSIFSHLAASEDANERDFSNQQIQTFQKITKELSEKLGYTPIRHTLNTSGILNFPEAQFDMVRSGIGLYGFGNDPNIDAQLRPVASLKTIISQIHHIQPHETVGYNRAFAAGDCRTTATLPLGHADGIGRQYGNGKTFVVVNGKKAPIIGNVCMDMIMVDITGIDCHEGDEVLIFGQQQSAEEFATFANTISYEIITAISHRVKRIVVG